ncbi:MAG: cadherin-like beta sandwich domain-containing protein, partial [Spirochaetes bacterium]|nr:cadherin-like beta sandwich domain-containing protein [Spirochaetota bacterium]
VVVKAKAQSTYATITLQTLAVVGRITSGRTALASKGSPTDKAGATVDVSNGTLLPLIVAVTAEDGGVQEYLVEVARADPDHNTALAELAVAGGRMSPAFTPKMLTYAVQVPYSTRQLVVTAKVQSKYATMQLVPGPVSAGTTAPSLQAKGDLAGKTGVTVEFPTAERIVLAVAVTAQDGKTVQYVLDVRRSPPDSNADLGALTASAGVLSPIFSPRIISYAVSLPSSIEGVKITASAASEVATVTVEGATGRPAATQTFTVAVAAGATETVNLIVTAEDGSQKLYRVRVSREAAAPGSGGTGKDTNARLASLQLAGAQLTPAFNPGLLDYEAKLASNVASVTLTALAESPGAVIAVDGQPLAGTGRVIALEAGAAKTVIIAVTAESGLVVQTILKLSREGSGTPPSTGTDRVSVFLNGVEVAKRELLALADSKGSIGEEARITVRYYRTNTVISQGTAKVAMKTQGVTPVLTASYLSPGVRLERGKMIEVEVAIPAGGANWLYYTEAQWSAASVEVDVPFLLFSNNTRVAWPTLGRAVKVIGYVSFLPDGPQKAERQSDSESFDLNAKGEYGVEVVFTSTSGQVLGTDTVWTKPGLPRSHVFPFTKVFSLPEGGSVKYTLMAKAKNGRAWSTTGTVQIWTTNLAYEGGFDPVILRLVDDLVPAK